MLREFEQPDIICGSSTGQEIATAINYNNDSIVTLASRVPFPLETNGTGSRYLADNGSYQTISATVSWGSITGTLSNQTDLQQELDNLSSGINSKENSLGNPSSDGMLLSSLTDGTRSWVNITTSTSFLDLTDTPSDYVGNAGKLVKVNATEDGLIYGDPSGTTVSWGDIQGTLSNQTDLQAALDAKSDINHTHTASDITDFDTEVSNNTEVSDNTANRHNHSNLTLLETIIDSGAGDQFLSDDGTYKSVSSGGIPEAPEDGNPYGRQDASWVQVEVQGSADNVQSNLDTHISANNPHDITPSVISAVESYNTQTTVPRCNGIETLTQAEYDALTPDENTLYIIVG